MYVWGGKREGETGTERIELSAYLLILYRTLQRVDNKMLHQVRPRYYRCKAVEQQEAVTYC